VDGDSGYLLDNRQAEAGARFGALSALFDPVTFAHLAAVGVGPGWSCWEVGAGGPSVAGWLAERVGPTGGVLATDIDLGWIPDDAPFEARQHRLGTDPVPEAAYDLVHVRLVLVHVPERERALAELVGAVRPGGWLVVEEADPELQPLVCPDAVGPAAELANRLKAGFRTLMAGRDVDLAYGRSLPRRLRGHGLVDVAADAYFPLSSPACATLELATVEQIRGRLVAAGIASDEEIDRHVANVRGGLTDLATSPLVSAWGRQPG
jgi:SAM-dependent methyltransferase